MPCLLPSGFHLSDPDRRAHLKLNAYSVPLPTGDVHLRLLLTSVPLSFSPKETKRVPAASRRVFVARRQVACGTDN